MSPFLSKVHQATVHALSGSAISLGGGAVSETSMKSTNMWRGHSNAQWVHHVERNNLKVLRLYIPRLSRCNCFYAKLGVNTEQCD